MVPFFLVYFQDPLRGRYQRLLRDIKGPASLLAKLTEGGVSDVWPSGLINTSPTGITYPLGH